MKITIDLNNEEAWQLVQHLGFVGFEMPHLDNFRKELFRKTAKQIWDEVHIPEVQLLLIATLKSSLLESIFNYTLPGEK